jgi:hypothetical protein
MSTFSAAVRWPGLPADCDGPRRGATAAPPRALRPAERFASPGVTLSGTCSAALHPLGLRCSLPNITRGDARRHSQLMMVRQWSRQPRPTLDWRPICPIRLQVRLAKHFALPRVILGDVCLGWPRVATPAPHSRAALPRRASPLPRRTPAPHSRAARRHSRAALPRRASPLPRPTAAGSAPWPPGQARDPRAPAAARR